MHFIGWGKLKIELYFDDIEMIEKRGTLKGLLNNAILVKMKVGKDYFFESFAFRENCFAFDEERSRYSREASRLEISAALSRKRGGA